MLQYIKSVVTVVLLFLAGSLLAQEHYTAWFRGTVSVPLATKFKVDGEFQHRRQNGYANKDMLANDLMFSFRSWVHYIPNEHIKLSVSPFAIFNNYAIIRQPADEHIKPGREIRFSAATELTQSITRKLYFINRPAVEYRTYDNTLPDMVRWRERIALSYHLSKTVNLAIYDDLLLNMAGAINTIAYDQNRWGIDLEYRALPKLKLNVGYMRIVRKPGTSSSLQRENNTILNVTYLLQKRKKVVC